MHYEMEMDLLLIADGNSLPLRKKPSRNLWSFSYNAAFIKHESPNLRIGGFSRLSPSIKMKPKAVT